MKILALETSAKSVSCAVVENGAPLASAYQCTGLTHSRTLLPMVDAMLKNADLTLDDINAIAIAAGPGSFTGLRIGIAAVKGLAWAADKPCLGVSTLEAMVQNAAHIDGLIVGAMDARRSQVYNAVFEAKGGELTRLTPDRAISLEELCAQLQGKQQPITVLGDGGVLCYRYLEEHGVKCSLAPSMLLYQSAVGFGTFQQLLTDFPAAKLHETIPNFHNTPDRCRLSARRSSATRWAAPRPFSRRSILLLQGKRRCPRSRTFFLPERSRSALRTTTQSSTTSFWTRRHERRSAL